MRITVTTIFNGRKFSSVEDAALAAVVDSMKESMESEIAPFADEIAAQGGEVILHFTGARLENIGGRMEVKNVSPDLKKRILAAIGN